MIIGILLILISLAEGVLGVWFLTRYQNNQSTKYYGWFAVAVAVYVLSNGLGYLLNNFYIAERFGWIGGLMTAAFILPFSYSFPLPRKRPDELIALILWPMAIFIPGLIFTNIFITDIDVIDYRAGYQTLAGEFFWFALLFFVSYWAWALANIWRTMQKSNGLHRWQLKMILTGLILSVVISAIFDILLPIIIKSTLGFVGSIFSAIWLAYTSRILLKK